MGATRPYAMSSSAPSAPRAPAGAAKNRVGNAHGGPKRRLSTCAHSNSTNYPHTARGTECLKNSWPRAGRGAGLSHVRGRGGGSASHPTHTRLTRAKTGRTTAARTSGPHASRCVPWPSSCDFDGQQYANISSRAREQDARQEHGLTWRSAQSACRSKWHHESRGSRDRRSRW